MKEATGELNMTVITVVAIAAVGALFTVFVWPNIQMNLMLSTACSQIDTEGNYETEEDSADKSISCTGFECTASYKGHTGKRKCNS
ncbi:MAG: hypothetical protein PUD34_05255 [bacterium]|nr:hypothetical protein [bacterium]